MPRSGEGESLNVPDQPEEVNVTQSSSKDSQLESQNEAASTSDSQNVKSKKRSSNWSSREQYLLVSSYVDQMDILSADHSGSGGQQKEKKRILDAILASINA